MAAYGTDQNSSRPIPAQTRRADRADGRVAGSSTSSRARPDVDPQDDALAVWADLLRLATHDLQQRERRALAHELTPPERLALGAERDKMALDRGGLPVAVVELPATDRERPAENAAEPIRELRSLLVAMQSRLIIAQAEGLLIARYTMSVDSAFGVLVRLSQETGVTLRETAARIVAASEGHRA